MYTKIFLMSILILLLSGCGTSDSNVKSYSVESFDNGDFTLSITIAKDAPAYSMYRILSQRDVTRYDAGDITKYLTTTSTVLTCI